MNEPVYLHDFQRPTLEQIVSEGCRKIDEAIERVCQKYEAPQIKQPDPFIEATRIGLDYLNQQMNVLNQTRNATLEERIRNEYAQCQSAYYRARFKNQLSGLYEMYGAAAQSIFMGVDK